MSRADAMAAQLREVFDPEPVEACLSVETEERFWVSEEVPSRRSVIEKRPPRRGGFAIVNPRRRRVYLLAVDNCFLERIAGYEGRRCDGVLFDERFFCFVELKLEVSKRATRKLREAREQLGDVIEFFREAFEERGVGFLGLELEAYVVMRQNVYPRHRASRDKVLVEFMERYGVRLFEASEKECA